MIGNTDSTRRRAPGQERSLPDEQPRQRRGALPSRSRGAPQRVLDRALAHFRAAHRLDPVSAQYRSFYGLALGLCERRWEQALELCRSAARDEFFDPVHYHNLARLHLAFGFKAEGLRLLKRGLMIAPGNEEIRDALRRPGRAQASAAGLPAAREPAEPLARQGDRASTPGAGARALPSA